MASSFQNRVRPRVKKRKKSRPNKPRPQQNETSFFWLSFAVVTLLICSLTLWLYFPASTPPTRPRVAPVPPVAVWSTPQETQLPVPKKTAKEIAMDRLQAEVINETGQEVSRTLAPLPPVAKPLPPMAKPVSEPAPSPDLAVATRPLPEPEALTAVRIAAYQTMLERQHFSCGFIDGDLGPRTQRMLRAYQESRALPVTGIFDDKTCQSLGEPGDPLETYTITAQNLEAIMPKPQTWREKSQVPTLGYNTMWELLAEKFHCARGYLKSLNPSVSELEEGTQIISPRVTPAEPLPHAAALRISLAETSLEALNAEGKIIAFFPCSIAADKNKRPNGVLKVISVVPNPDYTFDPQLFKEAAEKEGIHEKITLPPGPRNPVGTAWIGLSLPGYGIHGTPEPENIARTQSHGCFRLANWNAEKVLQMVTVGTPVEVEP